MALGTMVFSVMELLCGEPKLFLDAKENFKTYRRILTGK